MKNILKFAMALFIAINTTSCSLDDDGNVVGPTGETKTYALVSVDDPNIFGTARFIENNNNSTTIELELVGTPSGGMHPAHIHFNTAAEGGGIAVTLGTVDGTTGFSTITVNQLDDGTAITYDELLQFDGYINVHLSASDLGTLVAQGDIGENELTGESEVYALSSVDVPSASGTATFYERVNGEALAVLDLINTVDGEMHPAHIHAGSVATAPGAILFTFNSVDGTTGVSQTNVSVLDDDTVFGYDDVLTVDGYINVHLSAGDLGTLVAQGDIGINE